MLHTGLYLKCLPYGIMDDYSPSRHTTFYKSVVCHPKAPRWKIPDRQPNSITLMICQTQNDIKWTVGHYESVYHVKRTYKNYKYKNLTVFSNQKIYLDNIIVPMECPNILVPCLHDANFITTSAP